MISKPTNIDFPYYSELIHELESKDLMSSLHAGIDDFSDLGEGISESLGEYRYMPGKWSIKQVLKHLSDTERILSCRALKIARQDKQELFRFDENAYALVDFSSHLSIEEIKDEFVTVRKSTISLFKTLDPKSLDYIGKLENYSFTPRMIGWFIAGHTDHHLRFIREHYLTTEVFE